MLIESAHLDLQDNRIRVEISANYFAYEGQDLFAGWFHNITARCASRASVDRQNRSIQLLSQAAAQLLMEPQPDTLIKHAFDQVVRHPALLQRMLESEGHHVEHAGEFAVTQACITEAASGR